MKFIVDAQLPYTLSKHLAKKSFDIVHTDNLPLKERTTDNEIRQVSIKENRIVITKDSDFLDSYYIKGVPAKLLLITTGNIRNKELLKLFDANFDKICELFRNHTFVELSNSEIIAHE